jgi:hypothetical protein
LVADAFREEEKVEVIDDEEGCLRGPTGLRMADETESVEAEDSVRE